MQLWIVTGAVYNSPSVRGGAWRERFPRLRLT
jgi:hypothetical protein